MKPEEPTIVLGLGARVFYKEGHLNRLELILNPHFNRLGDHRHDYQNGWAKIGAALVEAYRHGYTAVGMGHPSGLVGDVRRWFRSNRELYNILDGREHQITLVIRHGEEHLLTYLVDASGTTTYTPVSRWTVEVTPNE
jgi:hypothetical protein